MMTCQECNCDRHHVIYVQYDQNEGCHVGLHEEGTSKKFPSATGLCRAVGFMNNCYQNTR